MLGKLRPDVNWFHNFLSYFFIHNTCDAFKQTRQIVKTLFFTLNKLF
jgi:hypothetical protein